VTRTHADLDDFALSRLNSGVERGDLALSTTSSAKLVVLAGVVASTLKPGWLRPFSL
jgi:hypothetical protein